jgi:hypothetical protein
MKPSFPCAFRSTPPAFSTTPPKQMPSNVSNDTGV